MTDLIDPTIPFLESALDPSQAKAHLQTVVADLQRVRAAILVRHRVGRRALVKYRLDTAAGPTTVLGKIRAKGIDHHSYQVQQYLWHHGWNAHSLDRISTPKPLGTVNAWRMILQRWVPGRSATQLLGTPQGLVLMPRLAAVAHKLHQSDMPTTKTHTLADELQILRDRLPLVIDRYPTWAARIDAVLAGCETLAVRVSQAGANESDIHSGVQQPSCPCRSDSSHPITPIHRDFYADQILVDGDRPGSQRLWLVDLDLCCQGSPAVDIGNMIAHITEQSLREFGDAGILRDRESALHDSYLDVCGLPASGRNVLGQEIDLYSMLTLVRHIHISTRIANRRPYTERLIRLCETRLEMAQAEPRES